MDLSTLSNHERLNLVGKKVRVTKCVPSRPEGHEATITAISDGYGGAIVYAKVDGVDDGPHDQGAWIIEDFDVLVEDDKRDVQIANLTADYARLTAQYNELNDFFERSMRYVSDALLEEAENRDWCSEFDDKLIALNSILPGPFRLRIRKTLVEVPMVAEGTARTRFSVWVYVESGETASEVANDSDNWKDSDGDDNSDLDISSMLDDEVANNGWDDYSSASRY
jgi:hypothetical protein